MQQGPIEHASFQEVLCRVAYRLVQIHYRKDPIAWTVHPPTSIHVLAFLMRERGFNNLYWTLSQAARWVANGYPLLVWKQRAPTEHGARAAHKRRPGRSR